MNMRIPTIAFAAVTLLFSAEVLTAQEATPPKKAHEICKRAEKVAAGGSANFLAAELLFEEALALSPNDPKVNEAMGRCQLNGPHRHQAVPYLLKAQSANPAAPYITYLTAYSLQLNSRWTEAIAMYEQHLVLFKDEDLNPPFNKAKKHIEECRNGMLSMASPTKAIVANMGEDINSVFADYGPLITADGAFMYFTTRRPAGFEAKVNKVTGDYFEDIYTSTNLAGEWVPALRMPSPMNSAVNDASVGMFNDGRTMIIFRDELGGGNLYETFYDRGKWSEPKDMGPNVNTIGHESSGWYSFDRQWLYFVSDRPDDSQGGKDIYRSPWNAAINGWGTAENLGPSVNTPYDEDGIFVHPDGRTIYFSSEGHNSIGGYDIFRSRLENDRWTAPESMGWPINSPDDDLFFALTADGRTGYFSSTRPDGIGEDDIYSVEFVRHDETASAASGAIAFLEETGTVLLKGRVNSAQIEAGLGSDIELMDLETAKLVATFQSDGATGDFLVAVPAGRNYAMYIKAEGYLPHSMNVSVPDGAQHSDLDVDITLEPMSEGHQVAMRNIFFRISSAALEQSSLAEMNQLESFLTKNKTLRLSIEGHTDNTGSVDLNQGLSQDRANSVRDHLLKRGIDPARLEAIGFGDTKPVATNENDKGRALNRRTEIKVL